MTVLEKGRANSAEHEESTWVGRGAGAQVTGKSPRALSVSGTVRARPGGRTDPRNEWNLENKGIWGTGGAEPQFEGETK